MKKFIFIIIYTATLISCTHAPKATHKIDYTSIPSYSQKNIQFTQLQFDTIKISADSNSMQGHFHIYQDTLYFADRILASILLYNEEGRFLASKFSKGRGPKELVGLSDIAIAPNGDITTIDPNWIITICDKNWNKLKNFMVQWPTSNSDKELAHHPDPNDIGIYEFNYTLMKMCFYDENHLLVPVETSHRKFNGYGEGEYSTYFYDESYTLGLLSLQSGKIEKIFCNYSPIYKKYSYLPNLKTPIFDLKNNKLYFSFQADPSIYEMNLQDSSIISFGEQGKEMNTDYRETVTIKEAYQNYPEDYQTCGQYFYLHYHPEKDLLFRGYRKDKAPKPDGLQIYHDRCLIADIEVPRDFKVFGYIAPWFYASAGNDYDTEQQTILRFKLDNYE